MTPIENPAWLTKTLAASFETLEAKVPSAWLPKLDKVRAGRGGNITARMKEYGCGAYGCVLPTLDSKIVLKVTTDETEAEFAAKLSRDLVVPVVVAYRMVMSLPAKHAGRRIYLLWRESAEEVGANTDKRVEKLFHEQHRAAQDAYQLMHDGETGRPLQDALAIWEQKLDAIGENPDFRYLASGMHRIYREQGIFLGDVHAGNVGKAMRDGAMTWIVVDPGHVSVVGR